jgi:hypothetical protein
MKNNKDNQQIAAAIDLRVRRAYPQWQMDSDQTGFCTRSRSCSTRTSTTRVSELKRVRFSPRLAAHNPLDA